MTDLWLQTDAAHNPIVFIFPWQAANHAWAGQRDQALAALAAWREHTRPLCPGFIRTQITKSARNLPQRFAGAVQRPEGPAAERARLVNERVSSGIDPLYVGELVREGIENDWPYIFTDNEFEPIIEGRFAAIKAGFDRIRGRQPRR